MKNKKKTKIVFIVAIIIVAVVIGTVLFLIKMSEPTENNKTGHPNTIQLFVDENYSDSNNLKKIHFADIFVNSNGELSLLMLDNPMSVNTTLLQTAIDKIRKEETLPLTVEPELGLIQSLQVPKNDSKYIYAVEEYISINYGFYTKLTEKTDRCDIGVNSVADSKLKNYMCEKIEGCGWLLLGGMVEKQYACCPVPMGGVEEMPSRCNILID